MRPAVIYGHPASLHTPQDVARLEEQTGRKAVITRHGVKLVSTEDAYDMVDRQSWLGRIGAFPDHGGDAA